MATLTRRGSGTPATTGSPAWATATNAVDGTPPANPATYATHTSTVSGGVSTIQTSGYNWSSFISSGATINSVTVTIRHLVSTASRYSTIQYQAYSGGVALGTIATGTITTAAHDNSATFPVTLAQLWAADFGVRVTVTRAGTTVSAVFSIDHADVTVDYTPLIPVTQAAYQFYDDGTETGSTALAAQDTAPSINVGSGDAVAQLRMRLQSTGAPPAATDDWQLQWEKNTSGSWTNVATLESVIAENTSVTNATMTNGLGVSYAATSQSFTGNGQKISKAAYYLQSVGNVAPLGNVWLEVRTHTGTLGSSSKPGTVLATSTAVAATSIPATAGWVTFTFDNTFTLANGTNYCLVCRCTTKGGSGGNELYWRYNSSSTHPGNEATTADLSTWSSWSTADDSFRVLFAASPVPTTVLAYDSANLTGAAATTNRLGAGTGSFVAGKISEDGVVNDFTWTATGHTEVLFSITLKQADLADGDTLRFRVLRDGGTGGLTYTQTPTISVLKSVGPSDQTWAGSTGTIGVAGISAAFVASGTVDWSGTEAAVGVAGITGDFSSITPPQTWTGSTATVGVAGESSAFVPGVATWNGSTATVGVAGITGTFIQTGVPQTWSGSTATVGVAGISAAFAPGPFSWIGSIAAIGVAGTSGAFVGGAVVWSGSTALVGVAGITGSFVASGTVAWSGSTATVGVEGVSGAFTAGTPPPQIWVTTPLIDDTFSGPAGTPLTAYTPPYVSDQYYPMMVLDGAGNAVAVDPGKTGGATHALQLPSDCWAEWVVSIPDVVAFTGIIGQIRLPGQFWYHGYNIQLTTTGGSGDLALLRNDVFDAARSVAVAVQANFDHAVRIEARGANFKLLLDGAVKLDWTDPAPLSGAGLVGPYTGISIYTDVVPTDAVKLRSYRAGAHVAASLMEIGVRGISGAFSEAAIAPQTWSGSVAEVGVAGISGAFATTIGPQTWSGSTATVGVAGITGAFVSGTVAWSGSVATVGVAGISGAFAAGIPPQTWNGSVAAVGVLGVSGTFTTGTAAWQGSIALVGVAGITGTFASLVGWSGSVATVGVAGQSGSFATGTAEWQGSVGVIGIAGISQAFAQATLAWQGSIARIGAESVSAEFDEAAVPAVWLGSIASLGIKGISLEWNADYFVYGMWNGQYVVGMMYNAEEIVEVALT